MFVVYHKETTKFLRILKNGYWQDANRFARKQDASAAITIAQRKIRQKIDRLMATGKDYDRKDAQKLIPAMEDMLNYVIATHEEHALIEKTETRYGVGPAHGNVYENVKVNTGWTTGPWSETYWES